MRDLFSQCTYVRACRSRLGMSICGIAQESQLRSRPRRILDTTCITPRRRHSQQHLTCSAVKLAHQRRTTNTCTHNHTHRVTHCVLVSPVWQQWQVQWQDSQPQTGQRKLQETGSTAGSTAHTGNAHSVAYTSKKKNSLRRSKRFYNCNATHRKFVHVTCYAQWQRLHAAQYS